VETGSTGDSAFFANYLQADFVSDSANTHRPDGVNNDPITHSLYAYFVHNYGGAENQTAPDEIAPILPAVNIFDYQPNNTCAALRYENEATGSRVVYLAFGFEGIAGPYENSASKLREKILQWFGETTTSVLDGSAEHQIRTSYQLNQNYPNPFNPTTLINYSIARDSHVKLMVYNTLGQVVAILVDGFQSKGAYYVKWDAHNQPSGLYIYRLEADGFSAAKKMFLQK